MIVTCKKIVKFEICGILSLTQASLIGLRNNLHYYEKKSLFKKVSKELLKTKKLFKIFKIN